jgi:RimJ/RimL family protein N-acetyltransferase
MGDWLVRMMNHPLPIETVCIGQEIDGNLVAVVGFASFMPKACQMHIAAVDEVNWMSRDLLWAAFDYPFNKLGVSVILGQVCADNESALKLNRHLGFKVIAEIADAHMDGDLVIMAMRREDCRWLDIKCPLRTVRVE